MIIKTLVENTSLSEELATEHGLSLYIETNKHKLLFDMGASQTFTENAKKMKVDLSEVELAIISHGHFDHGGGLEAFLKVNQKAKIYINQKAFGQHYDDRPGKDKAYIGLAQAFASNDRIIYVGDYFSLDDELELFSNIKGRKMYPSGNKSLFMKGDKGYMPDDFAHEQNLLIKEDGKEVLISGCSHNGIVNIFEHISAKKNITPSHVIGGFHLHNPSANKPEDPEKVQAIGEYLKNTGSMFYTCHCTGIESYNKLKGIMNDKIEYLSTGRQLTI